MKILITGADGFIGQNLIERLVIRDDIDILHYSTGTSPLLLERNLSECDFLIHLAAVHRPKDNNEFYRINDTFFKDILDTLKKYNNKCPVLLTSSIQATDNNDYGRSKKIAEELLREHGRENSSRIIIYRLLNTFGKWARPNVHSVVATFCYNISHELPITISNRLVQMRFYYIDDVIDDFVRQIESSDLDCQDTFASLPEELVHTITLGELADTLYYFHECDEKLTEPELDSTTKQHLWTTYQSYKEMK